MNSPIFLQTKLHPTQIATRSLQRERLFQELSRQADARVVVVTGPAGSGKSTLMADYVARRSRRSAWLGLGEEDQDPYVFFSYFFEALCQQFKGSCENTRNRLHGDDKDSQALCLHLINELFAYAEPVSIVLDDFHLVGTTAEIRDFFQTLCKRGPSNLQLTIVSRELPDLPLSWLRSKRLLCELHYDSLRFSWEETAELFRDIWGQDLESDLLATLLEKTEGWATGLQLVAQMIRDKAPAEVRRVVESLEGREDTIYTYLASEVFESQPPEIRSFLKFSSVPEAFNLELARELAPAGEVEVMLNHLQAARLFLVRLDRGGDWFRYHHLFRDFLRLKLLEEHGRSAVEGLHRQTAEWLYEHGEVVAAIPHYLAAGDPVLVCRILEAEGSNLLHQGLKTSLDRWLEQLPQTLRAGRPGLLALQSELWDLQGQWPRAVEGYRKALEDFRRLEDDRNVASVLEKLSLCYIKYGETKQLLETCEEGLRLCPPHQLGLSSMLQCWMGATLINNGGEWTRGYELLPRAHSLAFESGDPRAISWATLTYGFCFHFPQGNFPEALRTLNEGIDFFGRLGWPMVIYQLVMNKAVVLAIMGQVEEAQELVDDTLIQAKRAGHSYVEKGLETLRFICYLESGQLNSCREIMSKLSQSEIPAQFKPWFFRTRMLMHSMTANLDQARVDADEMQRSLTINGAGMYAPECYVSLAYMLLLCGDWDEAVRVLEGNLELCASARARFWEMKTHQMLAWAHEQGGDAEAFRTSLTRSLRMAQSNHYDHYWLADPLGVGLKLLVSAVAGEIELDYAERLLALANDRLSPVLEELLQSGDARVRKVVVTYLARQPQERHKAILKSAYESETDEEVRAVARKALRVTENVAILDIRALGMLRISREGEEIEYGRLLRPMAVKLLKFFVVNGLKLVPTEKIIDTFWPELDPDRARHNLATHMSNMRRSFRLPVLFQRIGDAIRLCPNEEVRLDVRTFEELAAAGLELSKAGSTEEAIRTLEQAEALYRGDLLEEDPYEDWVELRRQELRQLYQQVVENVGDLHLGQRHYDRAIPRYRRLLSADEPMEQVFPKLFRCYEATGDRQGIRKEFEQLRTRLRETCGVEPHPATRALVDSLFMNN